SRLTRPPSSPVFPYTTLFRSVEVNMDTTRFTGTITKSVHVAVATPNKQFFSSADLKLSATIRQDVVSNPGQFSFGVVTQGETPRSEEHTSELQSLRHLVCRLL